MKNASFKIENYCFSKVSIDLGNHTSDEYALKINPKGVYYPTKQIYTLVFQLIVKSGDKQEAFVDVICQADFKFDSLLQFEEIPDYFYNNSIAILFPYVRAYISLITTQANVPGIILPTMNLMGINEEVKCNTEIRE